MYILQYNKPEDKQVLTTESEECDIIADKTMLRKARADMMVELSKSKRGVGLASNQIGILKKFFLIKTKDLCLFVVNPYFEKGVGQVDSMEGCLSFAGEQPRSVKRFKKIYVSSVSIDDETFGQRERYVLEGFEAIVFQHEYDHLLGKTI